MSEVQAGLVQLDAAGRVWLDGDVIVIDDVRVHMETLPLFVNPDPTKYYRAVRVGETMTICVYDRAGVLADLGVGGYEVLSATQAELDKLAHGIAYDSAVSMIESNCWPVKVGWYDTGCVDEFAEKSVAESVRYLEMRGLIERDPECPAWVSIRDESEATA